MPHKYPMAARQEAIALARIVGAEEAARQLSFPDARSVRRWLAEAGDAPELSAPAAGWQQLHDLAMSKVHAAITAGKVRPKDLAVIGAIAARNVRDAEKAAPPRPTEPSRTETAIETLLLEAAAGLTLEQEDEYRRRVWALFSAVAKRSHEADPDLTDHRTPERTAWYVFRRILTRPDLTSADDPQELTEHQAAAFLEWGRAFLAAGDFSAGDPAPAPEPRLSEPVPDESGDEDQQQDRGHREIEAHRPTLLPQPVPGDVDERGDALPVPEYLRKPASKPKPVYDPWAPEHDPAVRLGRTAWAHIGDTE